MTTNLSSLIVVLGVSQLLSACASESPEQKVKKAWTEARAILSATAGTLDEPLTHIDAAMNHMIVVADSPAAITEETVGDRYPSYSSPPEAINRYQVMKTFDDIAAAYELQRQWEKAAATMKKEVDFARRWAVAHKLDPERDWFVLSSQINYARLLADWGARTSSVERIDQAWQQLKAIVAKPENVQLKQRSEFSFDATPAESLVDPGMVKGALKYIAAAYDSVGTDQKAAEVRKQEADFAAKWSASHPGLSQKKENYGLSRPLRLLPSRSK